MDILPAECQVYQDDAFGSVTTIQYEGEPWILARDVCKALGYHNIYVLMHNHVSDGNKMHLRVAEIVKKTAGRPPTLFINQLGLQEIVIHASKNPRAVAMRDWIFKNLAVTKIKPSVVSTSSTVSTAASSAPVPVRQHQLVELDERYGQALHSIYESQCELHKENQELKKELSSIKESLGELLSSMRINGTNWKDAAKIIVKRSGPRGDIQNRFHDLYHLLEQASHVNLKVRKENLQKRRGSKKISTLDAIEEDPKLVTLFVVILRNYALTHGVNITINENMKGAA